MKSKMEEQFRQQQSAHRPEGEVTLQKKRGTPPEQSFEGEYVDFEEVE